MQICDKYKPLQKTDFLGYSETITTIENTIEENNKSRILISGPSGCGKTSLVDYLVKKYKFKEIYIDAEFVKSHKHFQELFKNLQFTYYVKTCIVFSDFENIILDNIYNNTIKNAIEILPHTIIFTINCEHLEKFDKIFGDLNCSNFELYEVSVADMTKYIRKISKLENIKINTKEISQCISHLPDIRKCIQNIYCNNKKDLHLVHHCTKIEHYLHCGDLDIVKNSDLFHMIPYFHENYIKLSKKSSIIQMTQCLVFADIIQTYCYKSQTWNLSEHVLMYIFGNLKYAMQKHVNKKVVNGKILSRMSNKQTKYNTFSKLYDQNDCNTPDQLYLCKLLNCKSKLLQNQFM